MSDNQDSNGCSAGVLFFVAWLALVVMLLKHWMG